MRSWASDRGVHVSGHAHRDEQRRMLELVRPRAFVPVHGTLHHLTRHAALAREVGVDDVCVLENGDWAELAEGKITKRSHVDVPRVHVAHGREVPRAVLKERMALAAEGVVLVVLHLDAKGAIVAPPTFATRGVLALEECHDVFLAARTEIRAALADLAGDRAASDDPVTEAARLATRRAFGRALGWRPGVVVVVERAR